jgi:hypothetical protein
MASATASPRDQLKEIDGHLEEARDEQAELRKAKEHAAQKYATSGAKPGSAIYKTAQRAVAALRECDDRIEVLTEQKIGILERIGGVQSGQRAGNGPTSGQQYGGGNAWLQFARNIDPIGGTNRVEARFADVLTPRPTAAAVDVTPSLALTHPDVHAPFISLGQDRRFLSPLFSGIPLDPGTMAISDFRQIGARKSATVEADDDTVTSDGHGYSSGDQVIFLELTGGAPLELGTTYYVMASGLTANAFKVSATPGGSAVNVTADATAATVINLESLGRVVEGEIERDPVATTSKATLSLKTELATDPLRQFAIVAEDIPAKLFEIDELALERWLRDELHYQILRSIDVHIIARILDAAPLIGSVGPDLIAQTRNAVATMRDVGATPSVLAVNPTVAAGLDLTQNDNGDYIFAIRESGSASPLWNLRIAEVPKLANPVVIDPAMLGVWYSAGAALLGDPYTGLKENLVRIRLEGDGVFHTRNGDGAFVIG